MRSRLTTSLISQGLSSGRAHAQASTISQSRAGNGSIAAIPHFVRLDFAYATRSVLYVMAAIMAAAAIVAFTGLRAGVQEQEDSAVTDPGGDGLGDAARVGR
jgi:hypothetical protein